MTEGKCTPYGSNWIGKPEIAPKAFAYCAQFNDDKSCSAQRGYGNPGPYSCWWDEEYPYGCCKQRSGKTADCHLDRMACFTDFNNCFWDMQRCGAKSCATKCTAKQCEAAMCGRDMPYVCLNEKNDQIGCKSNSEGWDVPGPNPCASCCDVRSCDTIKDCESNECTPEQCKGAMCRNYSDYVCLDENNNQLGCSDDPNYWDGSTNPCASCCAVSSCKRPV